MSKKKDKKEKKQKLEKRQERRFVARSAWSPMLVRSVGMLGSALLGCGVYGYFWAKSFSDDPKWQPIPGYLIAAGAVLLGVAIWLGTSSEPTVRVGAPGIAVEKGDLRRMAWWAVKSIAFETGSLALVVSGDDESGKHWTFKVALKAQPEAVAWIVKEARDRIPKKVDISDEMLEQLPEAMPHAGMRVDLEPLQVVGHKCAQSGQTISFEPDARICTRCERVYFKRAVPKKCKCGANLEHLRAGSIQDAELVDDEAAEHEEEEEEKEAASEKSEA
ncbi:MAG TPA: hypothetical protein VIF62_33085 [Labilithrix sp.]|jgi:hypothetical protein